MIAVAILAAALLSASGPPDRAGEGKRAPGADAAPDPDADLLEHLEELEQLDLLQNLDLFDPGEAASPAPRPPQPPQPPQPDRR
jgi:hypothetical protein